MYRSQSDYEVAVALDSLLCCILLTCWQPVLRAGKAFPPAVFFRHGLKVKHFITTMTYDTKRVLTLFISLPSLFFPWFGVTTEAAIDKGKVKCNDARPEALNSRC